MNPYAKPGAPRARAVASAFDALGQAYAGRGLFGQAAACVEQSVEQLRAFYDSSDIEMANELFKLACLHYNAGGAQGKCALRAREALVVFERVELPQDGSGPPTSDADGPQGTLRKFLSLGSTSN